MNRAASVSAFRLRSPAAAIAWEIWRAQRNVFFILFGLIFVSAIGRLLCSNLVHRGILTSIAIPLLGLSLAAVFILFKFTESDRRERFTGFPSRLFAMPVRTWALVTLPMLYGVIVVTLVYVGWVTLVLRPLVPTHIRIGFPAVYLAVGMICFQSIVWALARFQMARLVVLGVWGTMLATGWMAFSPLMEQAQLGTTLAQALHVSVVAVQVSLLLVMGSVAYGIACWSVDRQRHGSDFKITWPRLRIFSARKTTAKRFNSAQAAQFWFEWRRNGVVLPIVTGAILLLIVAPFVVIVPFNGRAGGDTTVITLAWICVLPFVLAFFIGQGFGKTNFWGEVLGKNLGLPLFLATRPMKPADWISVKLKAAAWSAVITWVIVAMVVPIWLLTCCDLGSVPASIIALLQTVPLSMLEPVVLVPLALLLALAMLATWRLLVTNLYLGVFGSKSLYNAVNGALVLMIILPVAFGGWYSEHQGVVKNWSVVLDWLPWILGFLVITKFALAIHCLVRSRQRQLISSMNAWTYFLVWICGTQLLLLIVLAMPVDVAWQKILALLAMLVLPLFRISLLPLAFVRGRIQ